MNNPRWTDNDVRLLVRELSGITKNLKEVLKGTGRPLYNNFGDRVSLSQSLDTLQKQLLAKDHHMTHGSIMQSLHSKKMKDRLLGVIYAQELIEKREVPVAPAAPPVQAAPIEVLLPPSPPSLNSMIDAAIAQFKNDLRKELLGDVKQLFETAAAEIITAVKQEIFELQDFITKPSVPETVVIKTPAVNTPPTPQSISKMRGFKLDVIGLYPSEVQHVQQHFKPSEFQFRFLTPEQVKKTESFADHVIVCTSSVSHSAAERPKIFGSTMIYHHRGNTTLIEELGKLLGKLRASASA